MVVNEDDVMNIMGGMENASGIKLNDHKRKLKNRFEISRKLGQGTYGKVQLGINKETGQEVAIKTIKKSKIETEADLVRIRREIQIMSSVQHPNIIHIYEVFENKEKMVLVMEIAAGGELYDYLSDRKCLDDKEARRIFRQIAMATYYCHKNNICHRDLKLENILLDENGGAKIADFGLSNVYDGKNLLSTFCGSPLYASPEIVRGCPYVGPEVDCWSLGVLLYTLVYGAMPFDGSNFKRLVKQITTGDYYEPKKPASASHLIRTMLTVNPDKRANISDICAHAWVNDGYPESCLKEAEHLASLTPVRLDLLLSLAPPSGKEEVVVQQEEDEPPKVPTINEPDEGAMSIEELPPDSEVPNDLEDEHSEVSVSEPPDEAAKPVAKKRKEKTKRKLKETPSMLDPSLTAKKREPQMANGSKPSEAMEVCDNYDAMKDRVASPNPSKPSGAKEKGATKPKKKKDSVEGALEGAVSQTPPKSQQKQAQHPPTPPARTVPSATNKPFQTNEVNHTPSDPAPPLEPMVRRPSQKRSAKDQVAKADHESENAQQPRVMLERPNTPRGRAPSPELEETKAKLDALVAPLPPPKIPEPHQINQIGKAEAPKANEIGTQIQDQQLPSPEVPKMETVVSAPNTKKRVDIPEPSLPVSHKVPKRDVPPTNPSHIPNQSISAQKPTPDPLKPQPSPSPPEGHPLANKPSSMVEGQMDSQAPMMNGHTLSVDSSIESASEIPRMVPKTTPTIDTKLTLSITSSNDSKSTSAPLPKITPFEPSDNGSPTRKDGEQRGLINSVPKPYVAESAQPIERPVSPHVPKLLEPSNAVSNSTAGIHKERSPDSVGSAVSLSSSGSNHSIPAKTETTPNGTEIKIPNPALAENRDSKVIKAAAFWNNYIGEVISKAKPPDKEAVRTLDKPKKIVSAGVGSRGLNDLKNRYENPKPKKIEEDKLAINRRNSKKLNLEGCSPGLKVNDAKSVFETKSQPPPTPSLFRRNSVNSTSSSGSGSKWRPKKDSEGTDEKGSLPFGTKQANTAPRVQKTSLGKEPVPNFNPLNIPSQIKPKKSPNGPKSAPIPTITQSRSMEDQTKAMTEEKKGHENKRNSTIEDSSNIESVMLSKVNESLAASSRTRPISPRTPSPKATVVNPRSKPKVEGATKAKSEKTKEQPNYPEAHKNEGEVMFIAQTSHVEVRPNLKVDQKKTVEPAPVESEKPVVSEPSPVHKQDSIKSQDSTEDQDRESKLVVVGQLTRELFNADPVKFKKAVPTKTEEAPVTKILMPEGVKSVSSPGSPASHVTSPTQRSPPVVSLPVVKISFKPEPQKASLQPEVKVQSVKIKPKEVSTEPSKSPVHQDKQLTPQTKVVQENGVDIPKAPVAPQIQTQAEVVKPGGIPKTKTIEPEIKPGDNENKLEAVKSSLKKIPHAPAKNKKSPEEEEEGMTLDVIISPPLERKSYNDKIEKEVQAPTDNSRPPWQQGKIEASTNQPPNSAIEPSISPPRASITSEPSPSSKATPEWKQNSSPVLAKTEPPKQPGERIIPIQIHGTGSPRSEQESKPPKSQFVPIRVVGKGIGKPDPSVEDQDEALEKHDQFHGGGLSRNRWGSKKKRMSSAYSDSSMSDDDSSFGVVPLSGLQKYSSMGKHGPFGEDFQLKRTRPPFTMQRAESFSSEGEDDFDDDGMREITAENLFSTLLNRVKSLTKRIHDEHDHHVAWQHTNRLMNSSLNPGRTHARLERSALRNSQKRSGANTPVNFSRQSSLRDDGTSSLRSTDSSTLGQTDSPSSTLGSSRNMFRGVGAIPSTVSAHSSALPPTPEIGNQALRHKKAMEKKRLEHLHRQFSSELQDLEQDILQASLNKLKREATERSGDVSEISDGYMSPIEDTESINSEIFGIPETVRDFDERSIGDRFRKTSRGLSRLDEDSELASLTPSQVGSGSSGTRARPIARRSISRELFEDPKKSSARPVARRSISRELFDVNFTPSSNSNPRSKRDDMEAFKQHIKARERSMTRELDAFATDMGFVPPSSMMSQDRNRSVSLSRQSLADKLREESALRLPSRPSLTSHGRSLTQNDMGPTLDRFNSMDLDEDPFARRRTSITGGGGRLPSLEERGRSDWRRISVPERGKDFKSLPRRYERSESSRLPMLPSLLNQDSRLYGSSSSLSSIYQPNSGGYSSQPRNWYRQSTSLDPSIITYGTSSSCRPSPTSTATSTSSTSYYSPIDSYATLRRRPSEARNNEFRAKSMAFN